MSEAIERFGDIIAEPGRRIKSVRFQIVVETEPDLPAIPEGSVNYGRQETLVNVYELIPATSELFMKALAGDEISAAEFETDYGQRFDEVAKMIKDNKMEPDRATKQDIRNFMMVMGISESAARVLENQLVRRLFPQPETSQSDQNKPTE